MVSKSVAREQPVEFGIADPMRVLVFGLQRHEDDDVHDADLQIGHVFAQEGDGRDGLQCRNIAGTGHALWKPVSNYPS
jgi:hypothetical protein